MREPATVLGRACAALNAQGARYLVIGERARQLAGEVRGALDIELLVEPGRENLQRLLRALAGEGYLVQTDWLAGELVGRRVVVVGQSPSVSLICSADSTEFDAEFRRASPAIPEGVPLKYRGSNLG